jgi:hypothetical protein
MNKNKMFVASMLSFFVMNSAFAAVNCTTSKNNVVIDALSEIDLGPLVGSPISLKAADGTFFAMVVPVPMGQRLLFNAPFR